MTFLIRNSAGIADRWKHQYSDREGNWSSTAFGDSKAIYDAIVAAGRDCDAIDRAIGNKSWTYSVCAGCREYLDVAVRFGDDDNSILCLRCMKAAVAALEALRG